MKGSFSALRKKEKKRKTKTNEANENLKKSTLELVQYYWNTVAQVGKEKESY